MTRILFIVALATLLHACDEASQSAIARSGSALAIACSDPARCGEWELAVLDEEVVGASSATPVITTASGCGGPSPDRRCGIDADRDGVVALYDCNDADATVSPLALETRCDGRDQNCDGVDTCDRDHDGALDAEDCAPDNPAVRTECRGSGPVPSSLR